MTKKLLCLLILLKFTNGASQMLDNSFGENGVAIADFNPLYIDRAYKCNIKSDGKILISGYGTSTENVDFTFAQYDPDGTPDVSFGTNGMLAFDINSTNDYSLSSIIQPDGKIVAVGYTYDQGDTADSNIAVIRLNPDGSPDLSFGNSGIFIYDFPNGPIRAQRVTLQPDGKIVLACNASIVLPNITYPNAGLIRLNADGNIDPDFTQMIPFSGENKFSSIAIQQDGKIIAAGERTIAAYTDNMQVMRFNEDGSKDVSFGDNGNVEITFFDNYTAVAQEIILMDGKILLCGGLIKNISNYQHSFALTRLDSDGNLDLTFGTGGKTITASDSLFLAGNSAVMLDDGSIIVGGNATPQVLYISDICLAKYDSNGILDTSFGTDGLLTADFSNFDFCADIVPQGNGKILAIGYTLTPSAFMIARFDLGDDLGVVTNPNGSLIIYPNPASDLIFFDKGLFNQNYQIADITGKIIDKGMVNATGVDVSYLKTGIYFIKTEKSSVIKLAIK